MIALDQKAAAPPAGTGLQKEQAVQRMFSSIARYYDLNNSLLSLGLHHKWKREAVGFVPIGSKLYWIIEEATEIFPCLRLIGSILATGIIAAALINPIFRFARGKLFEARWEGRLFAVQRMP